MIRIQLAAILAIAMFSCAGRADAQTNPTQDLRASVAYDLSAKQWQPVIGYKAAELPNFLTLRRTAEVWFPVVGIGLADARTNLGAALVVPFRLADNAQVYMGGSAHVAPQERPRLGIVLGISVRR